MRVRATPRSTSVIVTVAPGINAPEGSLMLPKIRPTFACESSGAGTKDIERHTIRTKHIRVQSAKERIPTSCNRELTRVTMIISDAKLPCAIHQCQSDWVFVALS